MRTSCTALALALLSLGAAYPQAEAADRCLAETIIGGHPVRMTHCALSVLDRSGANILFSEQPLSDTEIEGFLISSHVRPFDPDGRPRSLLRIAFCPGGGTPDADPAAVRSLEMAIDSADSPILGRQMVFDPRSDARMSVTELAGSLKPGARLSGQITGAMTSDGQPYAWDLKFDLAVPAIEAAAGIGCGR
jgi:hypothetical protein